MDKQPLRVWILLVLGFISSYCVLLGLRSSDTSTGYDFSACPLPGGEPVSLGSLRGKVLLIKNVWSLWGTTTWDYTEMNNLQRRLGPRGLRVLGFRCNQFGYQENAKNEEILNSLKYIRPGGGFEPNSLPEPSDEPTALVTDPKYIIWSPVCRNDIAGNFEKFLVGLDGVPVSRYSRHFCTIDTESDKEALPKVFLVSRPEPENEASLQQLISALDSLTGS
ncbi:glutathione peroxidase 1-like [Acomys russatus]|uniref:glutathione peroxidase 1-like n=1 Tax=Acomys russatus TaxID=60746 RepID=UPI0021E33831|nr:glutathione peroxidase 1-like [Acomys russatus]